MFLTGMAAAAARPAAASAETTLPTIRLGNKEVTRLIAGGNPVLGYGHSTTRLNELMVRYFTVERITEFLLHCEREGINTFQSSWAPAVRDGLRAARERGSKIQYICLSADRPTVKFQDVLEMQPIGIVHHGVDTDRLIRAGQMQKVRDYVSRVRDAGLLAGVSTHNPDHLARVEDSGWKLDFYMACCYDLYRPAEEIKARLGDDVLGELYFAGDPARMLARVRQISKPCLAFKILAAGRKCDNKGSIDEAFRFAYANIKPGDGAIVGMFPIVSDEVREDAALARRYAARA